jgi:hypothetical protein
MSVMIRFASSLEIFATNAIDENESSTIDPFTALYKVCNTIKLTWT